MSVYGSSPGPYQSPTTYKCATPDLEGVPHSLPYPLPNTWAVNNSYFPPAQVIHPFRHEQFPTPINPNDDQYLNVYGTLQPSLALPVYYSLEDEDLHAPSTRADQPGNTFFSTYDVGHTFPQSQMPLFSESTSLGLPTDATPEVSITTHSATFIDERPNESPDALHGLIQTAEPNICQECTQPFPSAADLNRHAKCFHHNAFKCKCGKTYARLDILKRHCNQTPKFPCPHCKRYTGASAFAREDHLTQHLRTYHRINNLSDDNGPTQFNCTRRNCTQQQRSFGNKSQYTTHMRRIHNYSPFPCLVQGCVKKAGKGYFREKDMLKHSQEVHSIEN